MLNLLSPSYNQVTISFFRRSRRKIMSPEVCLPPSIFFNFFIPYNGTTDPRNAGRRMFRRGEGFTRVIKLDAVRGLPVQWGRKYAGLPHAEKHGSSFRFRNWRIVNVLVGEKVQARVSAFQNFCPTRVVFTRSFFSFFLFPRCGCRPILKGGIWVGNDEHVIGCDKSKIRVHSYQSLFALLPCFGYFLFHRSGCLFLRAESDRSSAIKLEVR